MTYAGFEGTWIVGDAGDAGGAIGLLGPNGFVRATVPGGAGSQTCNRSALGLTTPAFHGVGVAAPDGALWLRAGCFDDDDPFGPPVWLRAAVVSGGVQVETVAAQQSVAAPLAESVTVGPDAALWTVDVDNGLLARTAVAGVKPVKAKVASVKRVGSRWLATLRCDAPIGSVCAGTLRVRAAGRKVQSAKYFVSAASASRTTTVRRLHLPKRARGVSVSVR